jgi:hypothetical protein
MMKIDDLSLSALEFYSGASAWTGHAPFAMTLMKTLRPAVFVELGAYRGDSYLVFCQAVAEHHLSARCFAVDTWRGDQHTGGYEEDIYRQLKSYHAARYRNFSTLLRMDFDSAAGKFRPGSIDLLHIDGLHTYEAVRHDFETWLPKMSARGVVLLHDTCARHAGFGVFRFWDEIAPRYPSFEFRHSSGLGVLCVGSEPPPALLQFCQEQTTLAARQAFFERLGALLEAESRQRHATGGGSSWAHPKPSKNLWTRVRNEFRRGVARLRRAA